MNKVYNLQMFLQESASADNSSFISCEGELHDADGVKHISFKINDLETVSPILRRNMAGEVELIEVAGNAYGPRARMPRRESGTLALAGLRPARDKDGNELPAREITRADFSVITVHPVSFTDVEVCVAPTSSLTFVRKAAASRRAPQQTAQG